MAKIVLMEDCVLQAMMLSDWLEMEGHKVYVAHSGSAALEHLHQQNDVQLVITDLYGGDREDKAEGLDLIQAIRTYDILNVQSLPIITISGVELGAELGMKSAAESSSGDAPASDAHFKKPVDLAAFCKTITQLTCGNIQRPRASR